MHRLKRAFFARPTLTVARGLLGQELVRVDGPNRLSGLIVETEAYIGEGDLACHARAGRTPRTEVMYWKPGHLYVYFTYGMHFMANIVLEAEGFPAAVLLRAIAPTSGVALMQRRRGRADHIADGPGKLTQALGIDKAWNGLDVTRAESQLYIEPRPPIPDGQVQTAPRVGLGNTPEPWLSKPWNFSYIP